MQLVRNLLSGVVFGSVYGVFLRVLFGRVPGINLNAAGQGSATLVMTCAFLIFGPIAIGYLTISLSGKRPSQRFRDWVLVPWIPIIVSTAIAAAMNLEGLICIIMALPFTMVFASLGGIVAGRVAERTRRRDGFTTTCVALLPFLLAPIESQMNAPIEHRRVATEISINAPAERVWANIERVPRIQRSELPVNWTQRMGFPRPVEATLSFEGIGGVRHASFEGGLLFIETITNWEPNRVIRFSIRADTKHIPPTTLDEHVTIGGKYFDVLDGEYVIEPVAPCRVILHLSSDERLSTDFNGYAGLWSDAVMRDIQENILKVIKSRCERQ